MVCRLKKAMYGLKQALRTWMQGQTSIWKNQDLLKVNSNLYLKEIENGLLVNVIFMDDIIFGGNDELSDKLANE